MPRTTHANSGDARPQGQAVFGDSGVFAAFSMHETLVDHLEARMLERGTSADPIFMRFIGKFLYGNAPVSRYLPPDEEEKEVARALRSSRTSSTARAGPATRTPGSVMSKAKFPIAAGDCIKSVRRQTKTPEDQTYASNLASESPFNADAFHASRCHGRLKPRTAMPSHRDLATRAFPQPSRCTRRSSITLGGSDA
ncbi:hypothetical protein HPB50_020347 [Hyalomma asiaticum]|uniref:Uncharacterized protein n=1 Tax=Hyalomma asiaticum TaxID=266040 RepID=A0ACB7SPI2_HYAAI|nr:hypothetical protein HPB50_020347 [Hyalomma asiaticum]